MSAIPASLERRALSLGTAKAVDYGLQIMLPIVLTRALPPEAFGEYRLLWLAVATLMLITPMNMGGSLYYFLPRSDRPTQRLYINQAMLFLVFAGAISAWALSAWNPLLPGKLAGIVATHGAVVPAFVLLWLFASLLDALPTADERVRWQAKAVVSLAAVRAVALSAVALATRELGPVLWTLLAVTVFKAGLLLYYVGRHHGLGAPLLRKRTFGAQLRQAAPFALSSALNGLRIQGDQWVAAALFTVTQFASFSIAAAIGPLVNIFRQSVNHVFLPSMSRMQARGDLAGMLALNSRANCTVALLVYPLLAFVFVFAEELVALVYTRTYLEAVPVLRLYSVGFVIFVVELVSIFVVLHEGPFVARVNALVLTIALPLSILGALTLGLVGAALGSVVAIYAERLVSLKRIASLTDTPVARLQAWGTLAGLLLAATLAALAAGVALHWSDWPSLPELLVGGAVMALAYPPALYVTGQWSQLTGFLDSIRSKAVKA